VDLSLFLNFIYFCRRLLTKIIENELATIQNFYLDFWDFIIAKVIEFYFIFF
jgi:hypothetical protein